MPNLTDELRMGKEQHLNQFGTAVLVWCGKSVWCIKSSNLTYGLTQGILSESDVTLVLLQSRTYSVRFSTWKVWRLNQALVTHCVHKEKYYVCTYQWFAPRIGSFFFKCCNKRYFVPQLWEEIFAQNLIYMYTKMYDYDYVSLHVFTSCHPAKSFSI